MPLHSLYNNQFGVTRPQALIAGTYASSSFYNQAWYPDFGATHHVIPDPTNIMNVISLPGSDQV